MFDEILDPILLKLDKKQLHFAVLFSTKTNKTVLNPLSSE